MGTKQALPLMLVLCFSATAADQDRSAEPRGRAGGRRVILSTTGGDRASAYPMAPKVLRLGDCYLATWLDVARVNRGSVASHGLKGANNINSVETEVVLEWAVKN